jgi:hypothetical protein
MLNFIWESYQHDCNLAILSSMTNKRCKYNVMLCTARKQHKILYKTNINYTLPRSIKLNFIFKKANQPNKQHLVTS